MPNHGKIAEVIVEDTTTFNKNDSSPVRIYKSLKILGTVIVAGITIFSIVGAAYDIPKKIESHTETIKIQGKAIEGHSMEIREIQSQVSNDRTTMGEVKKSIDDVRKQQNVNSQQTTEISRVLTELNTTMKFFGENLKDLKQDIREMKERKP